MSTKAQIQANRYNAQQSSGPKTETGKAVVSNNAHKHGARSDRLINAAEASWEYGEPRRFGKTLMVFLR